MARESKLFLEVIIALQSYLDEGLTILSMEQLDHCLEMFQAELAELSSHSNCRIIAMLCSGLLVCTLCVCWTRPVIFDVLKPVH
jgi:hypothetical protein